MKVKIGNRTTSLTKDIVICHMANLLASRSIILRKENNFKIAYDKYKSLCYSYVKDRKSFVYAFGKEEWLEDFLLYEMNLNELLAQELTFKFSDNSSWNISLNDIANIRVVLEEEKKLDKMKLLENSIELVQWAQDNLHWYQIKPLAKLVDYESNPNVHEGEWSTVQKSIRKKNYELKK